MSSTKGVGTAQVRKEGRVTIPATVRRQLELEQGDIIRISIEPVGGESADD